MSKTGLAVALAVAAAAPSAVLAQSLGGDPAKGSEVFQDRCTACHVLAGVGQGPSLIGVVGRKAASLPDFNYSAGLKASGLVWSQPELDRFLSGPTKLVPGTAMRATVVDPGERHDLIAYLASLRPGAH
ncbi:MAG: c-type cytochrome [Caulobacteraceae bacterium]|nr:c-type cytochrome [Caulobacteraceae bacterium]